MDTNDTFVVNVPEIVEYYFLMGNNFFNQGDFVSAAESYAQVALIDPSVPWTFYNLACCLYNTRQFQVGANTCRDGLKYRPDDPDLLYMLGECLVKMKHWEEARAFYEAALVTRPDWSKPYIGLAQAYAACEEFSAVIDALKMAVRLDPQDLNALYELADVCDYLGLFQEAAHYLKRAIWLAPSNPNFHRKLGSALLNLRHFSEAKEVTKRAIRLDPYEPLSHLCLGIVCAAQKDFAEAADSLQWAIRLRPKLFEAHFELALVWQAMGRQKKANREFGRAFIIDRQKCRDRVTKRRELVKPFNK